jgi:hypothetical protein
LKNENNIETGRQSLPATSIREPLTDLLEEGVPLDEECCAWRDAQIRRRHAFTTGVGRGDEEYQSNEI